MHIKDAKQRPGISADKDVRYCSECKRCWEGKYRPNRVGVKYYKDFPSYGKSRVICENCKEQAIN